MLVRRNCAVVRTQNYCAISAMKPTENRPRNDRTKALDRTMDWSVLVQCSMSPRYIIYVMEPVGCHASASIAVTIRT
jgi:hypothetical protein